MSRTRKPAALTVKVAPKTAAAAKKAKAPKPAAAPVAKARDEFFGPDMALLDGIVAYIGTHPKAAGWKRVAAIHGAGFDPRMRESLAVALRLLDRVIRERDAISPMGGNDMVAHAHNLQSLYVQCTLEGFDMDDVPGAGLVEQCELAIRG